VSRAFDRARHCGATGKQGGGPCRHPKGARTDHRGTGKCWLHGGRTPNGRRHAQTEAAHNILRTLQIEASVDPVEALLEAVRVASWREMGLRQMLQGRRALFGPDHNDDERQDVVAAMHAEALDQRARIAKMAIDANIDERVVRMHERQAEAVMRALEAGLAAAGVAGAALDRARAAIVADLKAAVPVGANN
jgi:hypothetical protein